MRWSSSTAGGEEPQLQKGLKRIVQEWIDALTEALTATGAKGSGAQAKALDALSRIQGALVLSRALGDPAAFQQAAQRVREDLLAD